MKTFALAGLMTASAIVGSLITLSLSQTSFAQDNRHWTQQHPAGQASAQQQAATNAQFTQNQKYTEYSMIGGEWELEDFRDKINQAMQSGGWQPTGGIEIICLPYKKCTYNQAMVR